MYKWAFKFKSLFIDKHTLYQDKLIAQLNKEHQQLFKLYTQILQTDNLKKKLRLLKKFYYDYHLHILKEDKQLYAHLLIKFKFVEDKYNFVIQKQEEMKGITQFIEDFATKYSTIEALKTEEFTKDLETLGSALTNRVEFEENELYELYSYASR